MPTAVAVATVLGAGLISAIAVPPAHTLPRATRTADLTPQTHIPRDTSTPAALPGSLSPTVLRMNPTPGTSTQAAALPASPFLTLSAAGRPGGSAPTLASAGTRSTAGTGLARPPSPTRRPTSVRASSTRSAAAAGASAGATPPSGGSTGIHGWITTADGSRRLAPLTSADLSPGGGGSESLTVNPANKAQLLAGTGAALTESSAHLLMGLPAATRAATLKQLFAPGSGAGISLLRLPLGASDFALSAYTYDDNPHGGTDLQLTHESVAHDDAEIVPIVQAAVAINPALSVVATLWSAPAWMKTSGSLDGGSLISGYEQLYAQYLAVAVGQLRARGVPIEAITVDDEPENTAHGSSPTMSMAVTQEATVVEDTRSLLNAKGMSGVEILGYDHNWSDPSYPEELLADPSSNAALGGTAWHCYGGDPSAQLTVQNLDPHKEIWETECSGGDFSPSFATNLAYDIQTLGIAGTRDGSRSVLLWNLALDPRGGPHDGGCADCRGVLTINPASGVVTDNVEYDVLALLGRTTRPGAVRIDAGQPSGIASEAWQNTDGSRSLLLDNTHASGVISVTVTDGTLTATVRIPGGAAVSLAWG